MLKAKAKFPWIDRPTCIGPVLGTVAFPGEEHEVYSDDNGETWFVPLGLRYPKKWVELIGEQEEYEPPRSLLKGFLCHLTGMGKRDY